MEMGKQMVSVGVADRSNFFKTPVITEDFKEAMALAGFRYAEDLFLDKNPVEQQFGPVRFVAPLVHSFGMGQMEWASAMGVVNNRFKEVYVLVHFWYQEVGDETVVRSPSNIDTITHTRYN